MPESRIHRDDLIFGVAGIRQIVAMRLTMQPWYRRVWIAVTEWWDA